MITPGCGGSPGPTAAKYFTSYTELPSTRRVLCATFQFAGIWIEKALFSATTTCIVSGVTGGVSVRVAIGVAWDVAVAATVGVQVGGRVGRGRVRAGVGATGTGEQALSATRRINVSLRLCTRVPIRF